MTTLNPYEVLGLSRDATPAQIKAAYRKRAMETHPDHGGSAKEFSDVSRSNIVLSDQKKRSKYDRTGEMDEESPENAISAPLSIIIGFMQAAVIQNVEGNGGDPLSCDLMSIARSRFAQVITDLEKNKRKTEKVVEKLRKIAKKMRKNKKSETDFVTRALETHSSALAAQIMQADLQIKAHQDAIQMTHEYDFDADKPEPETMYHGLARSPFFTR